MNYSRRITFRQILVLAAAFLPMMIGSGQASEPAASQKTADGDEKIQITADRLISSGRENYAEFIGNVEARQGSFEIKSDKLRIYYKNLQGRSKKSTMGEESIEKIIATGRVKIWSADRTAETDRAEWNVTDGIIVLLGENSKVTSGGNNITGSKITFYQVDGRIKVEGHSGQRVKATFYQGKKENDRRAEEKP